MLFSYYIITEDETVQKIDVFKSQIKNLEIKGTSVKFTRTERESEHTYAGIVYYDVDLNFKGFTTREAAKETLVKSLNKEIDTYKNRIKLIQQKIKRL